MRNITIDASRRKNATIFIRLKRDYSGELRERIKGLSYKKWKDMGLSKGTLYYLKHNASNEKPFKIYGKVKEKLMEME